MFQTHIATWPYCLIVDWKGVRQRGGPLSQAVLADERHMLGHIVDCAADAQVCEDLLVFSELCQPVQVCLQMGQRLGI